MRSQFYFKVKPLISNLLIALTYLSLTQQVYAACADSAVGEITCSGSSGLTDTTYVGIIRLDNSATPTEFTLTGTDPGLLTGQSSSDFGALIRNNSNSVAGSSIFSFLGNNAVTINALGGSIRLDGVNYDTGEVLRIFDPFAWSNDANGNLLNSGNQVGIAAAIVAGPNLTSLTINAITANQNTYYTSIGDFGVPAVVSANGEFTAGVFANNPLLNLSTGGYRGYFGNVMSFGGATYTAPAVLDGSESAIVTSAGRTIVNGSVQGDLYVVDKNPLFTKAQEANPSLALAYGVNDVGPRDSVITLHTSEFIVGNVYLGSGKHEINIQNGTILGDIFVDQTASNVTEVVGGVPKALYEVHGDRQFTLNAILENNGVGIRNVFINGVEGASNTINYASSESPMYHQFIANGLGNNTMNYECKSGASVDLMGKPVGKNCFIDSGGTIQGFTTINLKGFPKFYNDISATGDINILTGYTSLTDGATFTASNMVISPGAVFLAPRDREGVFGLEDTLPAAFQTMGDVHANIINNGTLDLGNATLDVSGDVRFNAGSTFIADIGLFTTGKLNATGTTTFEDGVNFKTNIKPHTLVHNGDKYTVATNFEGILPAITNNKSLLQWNLGEANNDLLLRAEIKVPDYLLPQLTPAGNTALNAFFSYHGQNDPASDLQATFIRPDVVDGNIVRIAERLRPEINDAGIQMVLGNSHRLLNAIDTRLLDTYFAKRQGLDVDDVAAEGKAIPSSKGLWVLGYGDRASQESRKGVDGYGLSSVGFSAGLDKQFESPNSYSRAGVALGYSRGNASNSGQTVNNRIDMNSFLTAAYVSGVWDDLYINSSLGLAKHTNDTRRQLIEHTANGSHDSWQWLARADVGMPMGLNEQLTVIPMGSFDYSHIKESGYEENGKFSSLVFDYSRPDIGPLPTYTNGVPNFTILNSPINLRIASRSFDSFKAGFGGKVIYKFEENLWSGDLEMNAMLRHEFGDLRQDVNAQFIVGGNAFKATGIRPARNSLNIGGKVNLTSVDENDQLTLIASYDAELKENYFGQTVALNARYDFDQALSYIKASKVRLSKDVEKKGIPVQFVGATDKEIASLSEAMFTKTSATEIDKKQFERFKEISQFINGWVSALVQKNLDNYFNSYASDFETAEGVTRQQWERKSKTEIKNEVNAQVSISNLAIEPMGDKGVVAFTELKRLGTQLIKTDKILDLINREGRWFIVREDNIPMTE